MQQNTVDKCRQAWQSGMQLSKLLPDYQLYICTYIYTQASMLLYISADKWIVVKWHYCKLQLPLLLLLSIWQMSDA